MKWWKTAVIYEIYPKSFNGDIQGIIAKLDYLCDLGIDALWLCPIFMSPFMDSGYDVSDYYRINSDFGTMGDFEQLIEEAHSRGLGVILDMVVNHTSDTHPWFVSACESRDNPYHDYYIFRESGFGGPPNNWVSSKTLGSVWKYNEATNDYYLHVYTVHQPDLNWENERLREEIYRMLRFWLDKGVDGFRFDVINKIAKASGLPDFQYDADHLYADSMFENNPLVHNYIREMRQQVFSGYPDALLMGQTAGITTEQAIDYVHPDNRELDLYLQFEHIDIDKGYEGRRQSWTVEDFRNSLLKWQFLAEKGAWPTVFFGSHDAPRMAAHFGSVDPRYHVLSAKMLATLQLCLAGTQVIYMGDEWGLSNVDYKTIEEFLDVRSHVIYHKRMSKGEDSSSILEDLRLGARDNARYPLPWAAADEMLGDNASILEYYRSLIAFRKSEPALQQGNIRPFEVTCRDVFSYQRAYGNVIITVVANMGAKTVELDTGDCGKVVFYNYPSPSRMILRPYEVQVYRLEK